ncbi:putative gp5 C-terminal domain protein, partial [Vibrio parahaemolyticus B-265]
AWW